MSKLIKRADGTYSRRGLWDNIRANKGSGRKPTSEMLKQERKIKAAEKYPEGTKKLRTYDESKAPKQGNLLLPDLNRPSYKNKEGKTVSEAKITVGFDDGEYVIPTVIDGKQLTNDQAIAEFKRTGLHMGKYKNTQEAVEASKKRTEFYNYAANPKVKKPIIKDTAPMDNTRVSKFAKGGKVWTRKEGQNPEGGLNAKGRAAYNRENNANLKAPQPEGGSRRDSFCARMGGMKKKLTSAKTANDPNSRINKALKKWKCKYGKTIDKNVVIEIEGKKHPEIHTDKNFNVKNLGTIPHSKGGNVVMAKEGDIVFPTQNSSEKFKRVADLMKMKVSGTEQEKAYALKELEKERQKLPNDKPSKYDKGSKKVRTYKTTSIQTPDKLPTGKESDYTTRNPKKTSQRSIYNKLGTFKNRATGRTGIQTGNKNFDNRLSDAEFNSDKYQQTAQFVVYDKKTNKPIPYDPAVHNKNDAVRVITGAKGELLVDHDANQKPPLELKPQGTETIPTPNKIPEFKPVPEVEQIPEEAKAVASKKNSDFPVYVNEINNFARSNQRTPKRQERYLSPELAQYSDTSEALRNEVRNINAADSDNSRNLSGGSAANARSNFARAGADQSTRMASIQEAETQKAMNIQNANVGIKNNTQALNLGRFDNYQTMKEQDDAVRTAYGDMAVKGLDDKLQVERKDRKQATRDQQTLKHLRSQNYRYDEEGNLVPEKKKGTRGIKARKYTYGK